MKNKFKETPIGDGLRRVAEVRAEYEAEIAKLRERIAQLEAEAKERDAQEPVAYFTIINNKPFGYLIDNPEWERQLGFSDGERSLYAAPMSAKEGYQLVPVTVTPAMAVVYLNEFDVYETAQEMHDAMLAASKGEEK